MKNLVYAIVVTAALGGMNYLGLFDGMFTQTYERVIDETHVATSTVAVPTQAVDVLDEAQAALDRANKLLDEEEARLLEERAVIDARLEEIVKKRSAF